MNLKKTMRLLAAMAIFIPATSVSATDFVVGDGKGWTLGVNYTEWAWGKEFKVGDKLMFNYKVPDHDVAKVDGPSFRACSLATGNEPLATGMDEIVIATPGRKWYLCSKGNHCESGMKLFINVVSDAEAPSSPAAPPPPTSSSCSKVATSFFHYKTATLLLAVAAAAAAVAVMI